MCVIYKHMYVQIQRGQRRRMGVLLYQLLPYCFETESLAKQSQAVDEEAPAILLSPAA